MELCNHTYTTTAGRVFRCDTKPHPHRPDQHYFVRDLVMEERRKNSLRRNGPLRVVPGSR